MKKIAVLLLLFLLGVEAIDAQVFGLRFRKRTGTSDAAPVFSIQQPSSEPNFFTTASTIDLVGVGSDDRALTNYTWVNDAGGSGTGSFVYTSGVTSGTATIIPVATGSQVAQDSFQSTTNTLATAWTPGKGTAWTEALDTGTDDTLTVYTSPGNIGPTTTRSAEQTVYLITPSPSLSGTNFIIRGMRGDVGPISNGTTIAGLVYAYQDSSNFCQVHWRAGTSTGAIRHTRRTAGVNTNTEVTPNYSVIASDIVEVEVNGLGVIINTIPFGGSRVQRYSFTSAAPCGTAGGVGVVFGATSGSNAQHINSRIDQFEVIDRSTATPGIVLMDGMNNITVCSVDNAAQTGCDVIHVTKSAMDTTPPTLSILSPTSGVTAVGAETVTIRALDNVAVGSVAVTCPACVSVGTVTGTLPSAEADLTVAVVLTCNSTGSVDNVITATPTDVQKNVGNPVTITRNCATGDITDPVVDITSNSGATITTSASTYTLAGNVTDTGGATCCTITWSNSLGGNGVAAGVFPFSISAIALAVGNNDITVTATDGATNDGTDTIRITRTPPALSFNTTQLSPGTQGAQYGGTDGLAFSISGGVSPYTCTLNSGTLPTGMDLRGTGNCSLGGTPSGSGTTNNIVIHVVDSAATAVNSGNLSIAISASGTDYIQTLGAMGDKWRHWDWRTASTAGGNSQGYFNTQSAANNVASDPIMGLRLVIPFWGLHKTGAVVVSAISTTADLHQCVDVDNYTAQGISCIVVNIAGLSTGTIACNETKWVKVDNEVMQLVAPNGASSACSQGEPISANRGLYVRRHHNSTAAATHAAGAFIVWSTNAPHYNLNVDIRDTPTKKGADDGYTYVAVADFYIESNAANAYNTKVKTLTWDSWYNSSGKWWETKILSTGPTTAPRLTTNYCGTGFGGAGTLNPGDEGSVAVRPYNGDATTTVWADSFGDQIGLPSFRACSGQCVCPMVTVPVVKPTEWIRFVWRFQQVLNDWDIVDQWVMTETMNPTKFLEGIKASVSKVNPVPTDVGISLFRYELGTSTEDVLPYRQTDMRDLVFRSRHLTILRQPGLVGATTLTDADLVSRGILAKPQ